MERKPLIIEPMSTANKNITSTYDRKDETFLVDSKYKFPIYSFDVVTAILLEDRFILYKEKTQTEGDKSNNEGNEALVKNTNEEANVEVDKPDNMASSAEPEKPEAVKPEGKMKGMKKVHAKIKSSEMVELVFEPGRDFRRNEVEIVKFVNGHIKPSNSFVQLVIHDFYSKNQLIRIVDLFVKSIGFRGIQVITCSLCIGLRLREQTLALEYVNDKEGDASNDVPHGYCFLEDYTVIESKILGEDSKWINEVHLADNDDTADEFSRLKTLNFSAVHSCRRCDFRDETIEKMPKHLENSHGVKSEFEAEIFKYSGEEKENFNEMVEFLFTSKLIKVEGKKFRVKLDTASSKADEDLKPKKVVKTEKMEDKATQDDKSKKETPIEDIKDLTIKMEDLYEASLIFRELDTSKELWLTDKEWAIGRNRLLKEKILFYI